MSRASADNFFDRYAHDFAAIYGNDNRALDRLINALFRRSMRERYKRTIAACDPIEGRTVLDIGCGPGHYAVALARQGAARVTGIDFAPAMIHLARERAVAAGVAEQCDFIEADFMNHDFTNRFDYVILMGFMDYASDPSQTLARVRRLARKKVLLSFPVAAGFLAWQRRVRYKRKTALYMYNRAQIDALIAAHFDGHATVDRIGRDFFVSVSAPTDLDVGL